MTAGIDDFGALLVRVGDHMERIVSGEVIWLWCWSHAEDTKDTILCFYAPRY